MIEIFFGILYVMSPVIVLIIFINVYPWYGWRRYVLKRRKYIDSIRIKDCAIEPHYIDKKHGIARHKYTNEHIPIKKINNEWVVDLQQ